VKKILQSYALSLPILVVGIITFSQASNPSFMASADATGSGKSIGSTLVIIGLICLLIGAASIIYRYVDKIKR
jgi:uncharacterized membrane protein